MRLESLDIDHLDESPGGTQRLGRTAPRRWLRGVSRRAGRAGSDQAPRDAENAVIAVLNLVLDEAEPNLDDAGLSAIITWAMHRRYFHGREGAEPIARVWVGGADMPSGCLIQSETSIGLGIQITGL